MEFFDALPEPAKKGRPAYQYTDEVAELRANRGRWAIVMTATSDGQASTAASRIRSNGDDITVATRSNRAAGIIAVWATATIEEN